MTQNDLKAALQKHSKWLREEEGGARAYLAKAYLTGADLTKADLTDAYLTGADLAGADLTKAYLTGANLTWADLTGADLAGADLTGADLDFSSWPLWCGSLCIGKICVRVARQLAYHFCALPCNDPEFIAARNALLPFANKFHRVGECGILEPLPIEEEGEGADD